MRRVIRAIQGRFGRAVLFDTDTPVVEHAHSQCHVLIKCGGADGQYVVNGEAAPFRDDTIVMVNPWIPHHNPRPAGGPASRVLALYIEAEWLFEHERGMDIAFHRAGPFPVSSAPISASLRSLSRQLAAMMIAPNVSEIRAEQMLFGLIDQTLSTYAGDGVQDGLPKSGASPDFRIKRAIAHMRDNISKDVGMTQLARIAGLSRSHFFELFRSCTGLSPRLYMDALCLDAATRTLVATTDPLTEIAKTLGFSAPGHFSRFFHQHTSVSPSAYRRGAMAIDRNETGVSSGRARHFPPG
jgi:AraC family transcriptional regulator